MNEMSIMVLGFLLLSILSTTILVVWISRKYKVNPLNIKKMMKAWGKEYGH